MGAMGGIEGNEGEGENGGRGGNEKKAVNAVHQRTARNVRGMEIEGMWWDSQRCANQKVGQQVRRLDTVGCHRRGWL